MNSRLASFILLIASIPLFSSAQPRTGTNVETALSNAKVEPQATNVQDSRLQPSTVNQSSSGRSKTNPLDSLKDRLAKLPSAYMSYHGRGAGEWSVMRYYVQATNSLASPSVAVVVIKQDTRKEGLPMGNRFTATFQFRDDEWILTSLTQTTTETNGPHDLDVITSKVDLLRISSEFNFVQFLRNYIRSGRA
jgi:hypothetical protein